MGGSSGGTQSPVPRRAAAGAQSFASFRCRLLARHGWLLFVLPLAVFLLSGSLEPTPSRPGGAAIGLALRYETYPLIYALKIAATLAAVWCVWPGYRQFPWRCSRGAVGIGVLGAALWIGLCRLGLEQRLLTPLGLGSLVDLGRRAAFDPLAQFPGRPMLAWGFLALRFFGLAAVVPLIEEFFLRGFLMRFVMAADWQNVPFGKVNRLAVGVGIVVPMLGHPAELFAAAAWFSLVTWWMVRTRNIWDCVAVHAVTNLLLGVYVLVSGYVFHSGQWQLL